MRLSDLVRDLKEFNLVALVLRIGIEFSCYSWHLLVPRRLGGVEVVLAREGDYSWPPPIVIVRGFGASPRRSGKRHP